MTAPGGLRTVVPRPPFFPPRPSRFVGRSGELRVLAPGERSTDSYKATPDELYARGKAHFEADRMAEAAPPLDWPAQTSRSGML